MRNNITAIPNEHKLVLLVSFCTLELPKMQKVKDPRVGNSYLIDTCVSSPQDKIESLEGKTGNIHFYTNGENRKTKFQDSLSSFGEIEYF